MSSSEVSPITPSNFIHDVIEADLASGKVDTVVTRFPPEPNGYLHIGHVKAITINFTAAQKYGGRCHLRFDDTNPVKEDTEYVDAIQHDIHWLGFDWGQHLYYASDYFPKIYDCAVELIRRGAERGAQKLGRPLTECRVLVIGDTPKDVDAARGIGAESLGVGTGSFTAQQLLEHGATYAFDDLAAPGALAALLVGRP